MILVFLSVCFFNVSNDFRVFGGLAKVGDAAGSQARDMVVPDPQIRRSHFNFNIDVWGLLMECQ